MSLIRQAFTLPQREAPIKGELVHVRDPKSGPVPIKQYQAVNRPMTNDWDAEAAIKDAYLMSSIIFRCAKINAEKIASLPFRAGATLPDRPGEVAEFNPKARLAQLLGPFPGSPNPDTTPDQLIAHAAVQWQTCGRFGWEIEYAKKQQVANLWPLIAQYLKPIATDNKGGTRYFKGYEYTVKGQVVPYGQDDVFYAWQPSQYDWHQAESPLQAARLDAAVMIMQDMYDWSFLKNDSRPASVIIHQAFAEGDEYQAFKSQWTQEFGGPMNAGKPVFVPVEEGDVSGAMDIKTLGISQKDSDAYKRAERKARNLAISMGVPWSKLDASDRKFANSEIEDISWELETIVPLATAFQGQINLRLAPKVGPEFGWFDTSGLKCFQKKAHYQQVKPTEVYAANIITHNEARVAVGEEPIGPEGDKLKREFDPAPAPVVPPIAIAAAPEDDEPELVPVPEEEPIAASAPQGEIRNDLPRTAPGEEASGGERAIEGREPDGAKVPPVLAPLPMDDAEHSQPDPAEIRAAQWHSIDKQVTSLEAPFERAMRSLFTRQEKAVLRSLEGKRGRQAFKRDALQPFDSIPATLVLFDPRYWTEETAEHVAPLYESIAAIAGSQMTAEFDFAFDVKAPYVETFIQERSNKLAGQVSDTTYRQIQDAITEGVNAGESIDGIATRIRDVFDEATKVRSVMIARTEVISSYAQATIEAGLEAGSDVVAGKEWLTAPGASHPRHDEYAGLDGQTVGITEAFNVGMYRMRFPGDSLLGAPASEVIACRCAVSLLSPEEVAERKRSKAQYRRVEEVEAEIVRIATQLLNERSEVTQ